MCSIAIAGPAEALAGASALGVASSPRALAERHAARNAGLAMGLAREQPAAAMLVDFDRLEQGAHGSGKSLRRCHLRRERFALVAYS